jgi:pyruvate kinase
VRRTKLICTIGPASARRVDELVAAGMDVARLNFSHGTDDEHASALVDVRGAAELRGRPVAVMADLPGPKIRLGQLADEELALPVGSQLTLRPPGDGDGADGSVAITYAGLAGDVEIDDRLMLADGAVELRVTATRDEAVATEVIRGGSVRSGAGLNVPSQRLSLPAVTDRDRAALDVMLDLGVDYVAQSFVRRAADLDQLRRLMGHRAVPIVAKIETRAAVDNLAEILAAADAIMLARGDLGVELPFAEVPMLQKQIIDACIAAGIPVIVATQMLESMVSSPRPTRAEASDVANAVLDGADAVMLSAETAVGGYPLEAARAAIEICLRAEAEPVSGAVHDRSAVIGPDGDAGAIAAAAVALSRRSGDPPISGIACFTRSGLTARLLAAQRPACPITALSPDPAVVRRLALVRGVVSLRADTPHDTDAMLDLVDRSIRGRGLAAGSRIVIVASIPFGQARTNFLKLHRLAD